MVNTKLVTAVFGLAAVAGVVLSPVAAASGGTVDATGGANTSVDSDGTQGSLVPAVQGTTDSDGDQDAFLTGSEEAVPQTKAGGK